MTDQQAAVDPSVDGQADGTPGLAQEFEQRGLTLESAAEIPAVSGPLSAVGFASAGSDDGLSAIAAAVSADDQELFDLAVAAIQATHLDLTPATAVSIDSSADLAASVRQPHELFAVVRDGAPIGLVIRHHDRRGGGGDPGAEAMGQAMPSASTGPGPAGAGSAPGGALGGLGLLQDVVLEVAVELGRTRMPLARLMNLGVGSVVELDRSAGAPVDVRVNGTLFAKGEVVVVDDEYAVRILEILTPPGG